MPITEFVILEVLAPPDRALDDRPSSPTTAPANLFKSLASRQQNASSYPVLFLADSKKKTRVYILSGWKDVDSHLEWMKSEESQALLEAFGPYVRPEAFHHFDIDFTEIPKEIKTIICELLHPPLGSEKSAMALPVWVSQGKDLTGTMQDEYRLCAYREVVVNNLQGNDADAIIMYPVEPDYFSALF